MNIDIEPLPHARPVAANPAERMRRVRTLANALEVSEILNVASRAANLLTRIAQRSPVTGRHPATGRPAQLALSEDDAARARLLLTELATLSSVYTQRMRAPESQAHAAQPAHFLATAAEMLEARTNREAEELGRLAAYRSRFAGNGSCPVCFTALLSARAAAVGPSLDSMARPASYYGAAAEERRRDVTDSQAESAPAMPLALGADTKGAWTNSEPNELDEFVGAVDSLALRRHPEGPGAGTPGAGLIGEAVRRSASSRLRV